MNESVKFADDTIPAESSTDGSPQIMLMPEEAAPEAAARSNGGANAIAEPSFAFDQPEAENSNASVMSWKLSEPLVIEGRRVSGVAMFFCASVREGKDLSVAHTCMQGSMGVILTAPECSLCKHSFLMLRPQMLLVRFEFGCSLGAEKRRAWFNWGI